MSNKCIICGGEIKSVCRCPRQDTICKHGDLYHWSPYHKEYHAGLSDHSTDTSGPDCCKDKKVIKINENYIRIKTGTQEEGKTQAVFVILYALDGQPYKKYLHVDENNRDVEVPMALMQLRSDGYIGFPGGKVEPGEDLVSAAVREVQEEINYEILDPTKLIPFATFSSFDANIHTFTCQVRAEQLKSIQRLAVHSEHYMAEHTGCILPHLIEYEKGNGIRPFLQHNFIATAKMELEAFLSEIIGINLK